MSYDYLNINGTYNLKYIKPGESCKSIYYVRGENSKNEIYLPQGGRATSGEKSVINIMPQSKTAGLLLEKIEYISKEDAKPSNVILSAYYNANDNSMDLSWSSATADSSAFPNKIYYRIYRNGEWLCVTDKKLFKDMLLKPNVNYTYCIIPVNIRSTGEKSNEVTVYNSALNVHSGLVNPTKDIEYLGAFRFPDELDIVDLKSEMEHYPKGDINSIDGDTEFSGSIYMHGRALKHSVAEISIPKPVIAKNYSELPKAKLLTKEHPFAPSYAVHPTQQGINGLAYIEKYDRFFASTANNYYTGGVTGEIPASHSSFKYGGSELNGMWYIGAFL